MNLHLFNPENDSALAFGRAGYTPPSAAWQMHLSGEALPLWYGLSGDRFYSYGINDRWLGGVRSDMGVDIDVASAAEISSGVYAACPWGWSMYARSLFADAGFPSVYLPSDGQLGLWRRLSGRQLTVDFNSMLATGHGLDVYVPEVVSDPQRLLALCESGAGYVKQPWSGSGRGIMYTGVMCPAEVLRRSKGIINRQGAVMWEPALDKTMDFAMLFTCRGGRAYYEGLSLFTADASGRYSGNVLDTQCGIESAICRNLEAGAVDTVRGAVLAVLTELVAPYYDGPVGIDMMVHRRFDGSFGVAPCVEVNLRYTMGFVALGFSGRHLAAGSKGTLGVVDARTLPEPFGKYILDKSGKLVSGTFVLSPPAKFAFVAKVAYS